MLCKSKYKLSDEKAAELVKSIDIYHPYGVVGTLPWMNPKGAMEFGAVPDARKLVDLASKITTFSERQDSVHDSMHYKMGFASKLVFLGFAFHELNMELITPPKKFPEPSNTPVRCFATTFEVDPNEAKISVGQLHRLYIVDGQRWRKIEVKMLPVKCGEFFKQRPRILAY